MTIAFVSLLLGIFVYALIKIGSAENFFANESTEMDGLCFAQSEFTVANEASDNWVQLSPYGKFPNAAGLQVFTRNDAQNICNEFNSVAATGVRLMGLPFYVGHPDHDSFKAIYTDKKAYGRIKSLEARDGGLFANVKWSPAGKQLIEDQAFHGHSVNWRMNKIGGEWHPVSLKSVGFTNEPNIPVAPITAANEQQIEKETIMLKQIAKSLGLAEDATEAQIQTAVNEAQAKVISFTALQVALAAHNVKAEPDAVTAFANEAKTTKDKLATVTTEAATEKKRGDDEKARADANAITVANERKARAGVLIAAAIKEGRITKADQAGYETEFANEATFEATVTKLAGAKAKLPTESRVSFRAVVAPGSVSKMNEIENFVNEVQSKNPTISRDQAWAKAKKEKPALFERSSS